MEYYNTFSLTRFSPDTRSYIIASVLTIFVAISVRYFIHRLRQQNTGTLPGDSNTIPSIEAVNSRQSRLLRKQFGIIEDDLQLYEETITASDDVALVLSKCEVNTHSATDDLKCNTNGNNETKVQNNHILGTLLDFQNETNVTRTSGGEDEQSKRRQEQHSFDDVLPPSTPVTIQKRKIAWKERQKSQYERLQVYRREQMLISAESRLERQRQVRSRPPLFHFWNWYDTQTSLYRQYTLVRNDGIEDNTTIVPYHPSSRRSDKISIHLRITNDLDIPISVYWIDHNGKHIPKGVILARGGSWQQTTYVDHPWILKTTSAEIASTSDDINTEFSSQLGGTTERVLLHYIPHQVIPSTMDAPTVDDEIGSATGIHRFHVVPPVGDESMMYNCAVHDPILPFPASNHMLSARKAAEFALQHCLRMRYDKWTILQAYIRNIIEYPNDLKYRSMRIANPKFSDSVWNTPAKGVLLAYNFVEQSDTGYVCFGGNFDLNNKNNEDEEVKELSIETLQELQLLLHMIRVTERKTTIEAGYQ